METETRRCFFRISPQDNVATAMAEFEPCEAAVLAGGDGKKIRVRERIPVGHKIALREIKAGEPVVKYGVPIGGAVADIPAGCWVHLHNMKSFYDARSSSLDLMTGRPTDTRYE